MGRFFTLYQKSVNYRMRFSTYQKHTIEYLQSEDFQTREDAGHIPGSIENLIEINKKGFVTDNSQEGLHITGYNPDSKKYYSIKERAYVVGTMKEEDAYAFVKLINTYTDKVAFIVRNDPSKEYEKLYFETKNPTPTIAVTVSGTSSKSVADVDTYTAFTALQTTLPSMGMSKEFKSIQDKVEYVAVFDPVYCRKSTHKNGLHKDILDALKKI